MSPYTEPTSHGRRRTRDPLIGTWLDDRYLIEERIATGGFAAVYRARSADGATVALKVLHPRLTADPAMVARFRREGATLARLRDPHTVRTLAVGATRDGLPYLAMELLTGESLLDRLARRHALPWQQAVAIAQAVCGSLAEAHALGVVHRDLKPANIQIEPAGARGERVVVIDFGVARVAPGSAADDGMELTIAGHTIGTSDYMSPEQLVGDRCEAASDIYSLGVVLYEMLTGWRPFSRLTSPAATLTALLTETPQPPSAFASLPPALDRVVMRCLARDPEQRFAGVGELTAELDRLAGRSLGGGDTTTAPRPCLQIESVDVPLDDAPAIYEVHEVAAIRDGDLALPQPAPPARGSTRDARPRFDGFATLQGVAVPTERSSRPRLATATPSSQPLLPAVPVPLASPPRPPRSRWRERIVVAAILISAAVLAGLATYALARAL